MKSPLENPNGVAEFCADYGVRVSSRIVGAAYADCIIHGDDRIMILWENWQRQPSPQHGDFTFATGGLSFDTKYPDTLFFQVADGGDKLYIHKANGDDEDDDARASKSIVESRDIFRDDYLQKIDTLSRSADDEFIAGFTAWKEVISARPVRNPIAERAAKVLLPRPGIAVGIFDMDGEVSDVLIITATEAHQAADDAFLSVLQRNAEENPAMWMNLPGVVEYCADRNPYMRKGYTIPEAVTVNTEIVAFAEKTHDEYRLRNGDPAISR